MDTFFNQANDIAEHLEQVLFDSKISRLLITPMYSITESRMSLPRNEANGWQSAQLKYIENDQLFFKMDKPLVKCVPEYRYYIHFEQNRMPHQMNRFALDLMAQRQLESFIFPNAAVANASRPFIKFENM